MKGQWSNILPMKAELPDTHTHKSITVAASWEWTFLNCVTRLSWPQDILLTPCSNEQWFPFEGHSLFTAENVYSWIMVIGSGILTSWTHLSHFVDWLIRDHSKGKFDHISSLLELSVASSCWVWPVRPQASWLSSTCTYQGQGHLCLSPPTVNFVKPL